ncbi:MAG: carboxypeptidase-like regulatory domain-containing protein [Bryobacteraceae bacterium]
MHMLLCRKPQNLAWLLLALSAGLYGQSPTTGSLSGVVVNRATNAPIRRAVVTLSTLETTPQDAVAWTDGAGRYSFSFLPAGRYQLFAGKDGFQAAAFGAESRNRPPVILVLTAGENRPNVNLRLAPFSAVEGTVLDEGGDPLPGVEIQLMTAGYQKRKRMLFPTSGAMTDSDGRYRIPNVVPGKYAVMAQTPQSIVKAQPEVSAGQPQEPRMYGALYYPGSASAESAALISVEPGRDVEQISFRLPPPASPATVQGKVAFPQGVAPSGPVRVLFLGAEFGSRSMMGTQAAPPEFTFHVQNLRQDRYKVMARTSIDGREYSANQEVDLRAQSEASLALALEPAVDLAGSVKVEGPDAAGHIVEFVSLSPGDPRMQQSDRPVRASVNKDGTFLLRNVLPGVWDVNAGPIPRGGYLKSIHLGAQDVLVDDMLISSKTNTPLHVVISTQAATLQGEVKGAGESARATVLVAPEGKYRGVTSFYRFASPDEKGHYEIKGLFPGKYRLYVMEDFDMAYVHDLDLLKPREATSLLVELKDGEAATQDLTLLPRPGTNQ